MDKDFLSHNSYERLTSKKAKAKRQRPKDKRNILNSCFLCTKRDSLIKNTLMTSSAFPNKLIKLSKFIDMFYSIIISHNAEIKNRVYKTTPFSTNTMTNFKNKTTLLNFVIFTSSSE